MPASPEAPPPPASPHLLPGSHWSLLSIGANPLPDALPTWDQLTTALTSPDDGTLAMAAITIVGWLAWAFLTAAIALEITSRLRRAPTPHLPGLALPQAAARGLVGAAVLLFVAAPTITAPAAHAAPAPAQTAPASTTDPALTHTVGDPGSTRSVPARDHQRTTHTVTRGESLWSIAQDHLGSGHRWTELAAAEPRHRRRPPRPARARDRAVPARREHRSPRALYTPGALPRPARRHPQRHRAGPAGRRGPVPRDLRRVPAHAAAGRAAPDRPRPHRPRVDPHHPEPGRPATGGSPTARPGAPQ